MKKISLLTWVGIAGIAVAAYFIWKSRKPKQSTTATNGTTGTTGNIGTALPDPTATTTQSTTTGQMYVFSEAEKSATLRKGSSGRNVKALQIWLNNQNTGIMQKLVIDGIFGDATQSALMRYKSSTEINIKSLEIDAISGDETKIYKKTWLGTFAELTPINATGGSFGTSGSW